MDKGNKRMKKILFILSMLLVLLLAVGASADMVTIDLDVGSTLPDVDYGWAKLSLNATNGIDVEVNLTNSGAKIVNTGFPYSFAFNMVDPEVQIGVSSLDPDYSLVNSGNPSAGGMDGFGAFEYGVLFNAKGGGAGTDSVLTFTVTRAGGFTTVAQLVEGSTHPPGDITSFFAVDVIYQGATGIIGDTVNPVPEPSTMLQLLLGFGLIGLVELRRKFKK
jgi:hypothetical protein